MKELNRKVFNTIFIILSIFIFIGLLTYNITIYNKEHHNISRNLSYREEVNKPTPIDMNNDLDQMIIMDYEVYTVILNNNSIERIISHSNESTTFDIEYIANKIINKKQGLYIGNLYLNNYSYNYNNNSIVIINTTDIKYRLIIGLIWSLLIFIILEIIIYIISKELTKKITKPAEDSFNKQKDFIADASHELKTPLAVIIASSDELKSDKKNSKYIDNIKYESERMNKLITSLLDLSKLERKEKIYKEENISKIIEKTSLSFEAIAFENNISIDTNIEEDIIFNCSKDDIEKLISIILDNAIKHSYKDTTINVITKKNKNNIEINIVNTGDPINKGDEEKIFERFYRSDKSRNRESNRYGLGLAIAKNIVTNHNGTIKAYSKDNTTTFTIILKK